MKVKVFHIRLTKEHLATDQEAINIFFENVNVTKTETELVNGQTKFWSILTFYDENAKCINEKTPNKISYIDETELTTHEKEDFESLRLWRQDKAKHLGVPNFMICHNTELISIAKVKPKKTEDLYKIKGFGKRKITRFGDDIIALISSNSE